MHIEYIANVMTTPLIWLNSWDASIRRVLAHEAQTNPMFDWLVRAKQIVPHAKIEREIAAWVEVVHLWKRGKPTESAERVNESEQIKPWECQSFVRCSLYVQYHGLHCLARDAHQMRRP